MNTEQADRLRSAGIAASQQSADLKPEQCVTPCPLAQERYVLDVEVVGEDNLPVSGIAVELRKSPTEVLFDCTGPSGAVRFGRLRPGGYQISLYELDSEAWELISARPLPEAEAKSSGDAEWGAPPQPEEPGIVTHKTVQGECIPKLADRFGFSREMLWNFGGNSELAAKRKDLNVLNPGDSVKIPPKKFKTVPGTAAQVHRLRRKGVPETLRLRFLREGKPRTGVDPLYMAFFVTP